MTLLADAIYFKKFDFNNKDALEKWEKMILNGQVKYELLTRGNNGFVEALSNETCSALYYRVGYKLKDYPLLTWKWRAVRFPDKSKAATEKERNDYAARVYIIFPFLSFSSSKFIEYVWDDTLPEGTIKESPDGKNIRMIVVKSGPAKGGEWVQQTRNVYDDYAKAFGKKPTMGVGAVAIMCDADNTKTVAEAYFDDIYIGNEGGEVRRIN